MFQSSPCARSIPRFRATRIVSLITERTRRPYMRFVACRVRTLQYMESITDKIHFLGMVHVCSIAESMYLPSCSTVQHLCNTTRSRKRKVLTKHVYEEELGDIPVAVFGILLLKGRADACALLCNHSSLLRGGLARPHCPDKLPELDRHLSGVPSEDSKPRIWDEILISNSLTKVPSNDGASSRGANETTRLRGRSSSLGE